MPVGESGPVPHAIHLFAHRGGMAHRRENTLEAFTYAQSLGIGGVETDVWLTRDGVPVLHHDARVRTPHGRRKIAEIARVDLPAHVPSLGDLYDRCGTDMDVAIDVLDPAAASAVVTAARSAGGSAVSKLWLCSPLVETLVSWRHLDDAIHLVHSDNSWNRVHRSDPAAHTRHLRELSIDVLNVQYRSCSRAVVRACHEQQIALFVWGVSRISTMHRLLDLGVDGLMSDHVDRLIGLGSSPTT